MGTEQKHRTTLEIAVDDRALKNLGASLERALNVSATDAFEKSIERSTKAITKLVEQVDKLAKRQDDGDRKARERERRDKEREKQRPGPGTVAATALGTALGQTIHGVGRSMPINEGFIAPGLSTVAGGLGNVAGWGASFVPGIGPGLGIATSALGNALGGVLGGSIGAAQQYHAQFAAMQRARAGAFGRSGVGDFEGLAGATTEFGMGPTDLPQFLAELAQGMQQRGGPVSTTAPHAARLNAMLGVGPGQLGAFMAASGGASMGGRRMPGMEMDAAEEALGTAVEMGISRTRLGEFLAQIAQSTDDMQSRGIMITPESAIALGRALAGLGRSSGFGGMAGARAAQSLVQGVQGAGRRESLMDMMLLQEAGFGRGRSYMGALQHLQESPHEVIANFLRRQQGWGGDSQQREGVAFSLMTGFEQFGVRLSARQAQGLAGMSPEQLQRFTGSGGREAFERYLAEQEDASRGAGFGTAAGEAGYEYRRAGIGGGAEVQEAVRSVRGLETRLVQQTLPRVLNVVNEMIDFGEELADAWEEGGLGAVARRIMSAIGSGATSLVNAPIPGTDGRTLADGYNEWMQGWQILADEIRSLVQAIRNMPGLGSLLGGGPQARMLPGVRIENPEDIANALAATGRVGYG